MEKRTQEVLRPSDVVVLLQALLEEAEAGWTYAQLGAALGLSTSRVHDSIRRCTRAQLIRGRGRRVSMPNLMEFLLHGVRFAFPGAVGPLGQGVPTATFTEPMTRLLSATGEPLVWASLGEGTLRGQTVTPLHPNVPEIARRDPRMHALLALVDSLRLGGSRERKVAAQALREQLEGVRR